MGGWPDLMTEHKKMEKENNLERDFVFPELARGKGSYYCSGEGREERKIVVVSVRVGDKDPPYSHSLLISRMRVGEDN